MTQQRGFTLVELSIVLVILGLLIGGVLTGQSLIRAAELRSVATQHQRYLAAVHTFRDKYFALPGDMTNAQRYWGAAPAANCPGDSTTPSSDATTCNGDGNGQIDVSAASNEYFRFWQHLANAGLIEGRYNGVQGGTANFATTSSNSPSGRLSGSLWKMAYVGTYTGATYQFAGQYGNALLFGKGNSNQGPSDPLFKPEEMYNIDTKIDDGKPATGNTVVMATSGLAGCTSTSTFTDLTATYLLSGSSQTCAVFFRNLF